MHIFSSETTSSFQLGLSQQQLESLLTSPSKHGSDSQSQARVAGQQQLLLGPWGQKGMVWRHQEN